MGWENSQATHIWIFAVGRGIAAFVRTGLNQGFLIDMGASDDFDPAGFIKKTFVPKLSSYPQENGRKIAQAVLSHPHCDHIAQCSEVESKELSSSLLTCPHDKSEAEKIDWKRIENPEGTDDLIADYRNLYRDRSLPLQTIQYDSRFNIPNLEYGVFYVRPPVCGTLHESDNNKYGNATSIMVYFRHGRDTILLPGDMTPEGMKTVLNEERGMEKRYTIFNDMVTRKHPTWHEETGDQPSLKSLLQSHGLSILVAPHHGLESCYSEDLYDAIQGGKPQLVVISERRHKKKTDGKVDLRYQSERGASGLQVEIEGKTVDRRSLSTVNGHHILIVFSGRGCPRVYADRNPRILPSKIGG